MEEDKKMNTETVKGFRDIEGQEAKKRLEIQKILTSEFEKFGFEPVETPIIEYEEFVKGENANDEAVSDIFKLKDRGERNLALRYEFTFQLKRLAQNKKLPYKRFQIGPVFRDEPISANRFRQFTQCDVDIIGSTIKSEAEILYMSKKILNKIGINAIFYINNRKLLNSIISWSGIKEKKAEEVIKELDKMDKLSGDQIKENLKKIGLGSLEITKLFLCFNNGRDLDWFSEKNFNGTEELKELIDNLKLYNVDPIFLPNLARGLSYYNGNIFEIKSDIKETVCAGGSYLVNEIQSTGISLGLDRLAIVSNLEIKTKNVLVVSINQDKQAIGIIEKLREKSISCSLFFGKPGKALEYANSKKIDFVLFIGDNEVKSKKYTLKNMGSGKELKVAEKDLISKLK